MVQSGMRQPNAAQTLAVRCLEALGKPYSIDGQVMVGVSIGIGLADGSVESADVDTLMRNGDLAMYGAKQAGRGQLRFFDSPTARKAVPPSARWRRLERA